MNLKYYTQFGKALKKIRFLINGFTLYAMPRKCFRMFRHRLLHSIPKELQKEVQMRVDYYCRCLPASLPENDSIRIADYKYPFNKKKKFTTYFFDLNRCLVFFDQNLRFRYEFGDVTLEPELPTLLKSRPIAGETSNSVVLKLDRERHFQFIHDRKSFRQKKDMLVSRNCVHQPHRVAFMERYFGHPMCNVGQINKDMIHNGHTEWVREYLSLDDQLDYKFICCIEGNDVATNLKWVMSSNSLPVMPRPRYETWFMEGTLIPGYHYVEIKDDYSDLIEKMNYYIAHPEEAEAIIQHNHEYIQKFRNSSLERKISLLVLEKYFRLTKQIHT